MRAIGLTGGIASGKSTVAALLRARGAAIIDADQLAREVVAPGTPGLAELAAAFPGAVGPDGRLDRARLGALVFGDPAQRARLDAIVHPRVGEAMARRAAELAHQGAPRAFFDVPLLIETGLHQAMHDVLVVWVPRDVQRARLMARDGCTAEEAEARLAAQLPLDEKRRHATWVIDNGGTREATSAQLEAVWQEILARPPV